MKSRQKAFLKTEKSGGKNWINICEGWFIKRKCSKQQKKGGTNYENDRKSYE